MHFLSVVVMVSVVVAAACTQRALASPSSPLPSGLRPVPSPASFPAARSLLEVSTRPWLYHLSLKLGQNITKLSQIPQAELQAMADKGYEYVWFMGVWALGPYGLHLDKTSPSLLAHYAQVLPGYTQEDIIGSPYAITEYSCNPELGSDADIAALRQRLHALGLKLMLDFVPNHTAVDCTWNATNPEYYIHAPKGTQPPYNPNVYYDNGIAYGSAGGNGGWPDTLQLNYWNPAVRAVRTQQLLKVASLADGIRCDMAYLELNDLFHDNWGAQLDSWGWARPSTEFWADAIQAVKAQYPEVIMLAEVYQPWQKATQAVGFDYTYDKQIYDKLGNGNLDDIRGWITGNSEQFIQHSAHFVSNHDQQRAADYFGSWYRANAAALVTYTLPGLRFHWMWQENGFTSQVDVHLRREVTQQPVAESRGFYDKFLGIMNQEVFRLGEWTFLPVSGDQSWKLLAWSWAYQGQKRLCVLNYSSTNAVASVLVPNAQAVNGNDTIPVTDLLSGDTYWRSAEAMRDQGLQLVVNSWYGQIFQYD